MLGTHGYPRPQLRRDEWWSLDGAWEFALDADARWSHADEVAWSGTIRVPFSPETVASGIGDRGYYKAAWYRRSFMAPALERGQRLILHFGAVDTDATVWLNGGLVTRHEGGYSPFSADVTSYLRIGMPQDLVVRAYDDPLDLTKPRGKQDWQPQPHAIWYPRTTGIWQNVWLERLGPHAISRVRWASSIERWEVAFEAHVDGPPRDDLVLHLRLHIVDNVLADDRYTVVAGEVVRRIALSDPGIDDHRNELLWTPNRPTLIQADCELVDRHGTVLDKVASYTAIRSVGTSGDRFILNGRPYRLRMVLDQGYWPESGLTPPSDDAIVRDIELIKAMGFNAVRKHQKIEHPRFLYWADLMGLMVWEEMPSAYRFTPSSVRRLAREWQEIIERDRSHPCIVAWVPFNESWGVPDLPAIPEQRHYVQAMYHLTRTLDPDRPVVGNDGWESLATDIIGIHDYETDAAKLRERYASDAMIPHLFERLRPAGRVLTVPGHPHAGQPIVLSEFGGLALSVTEGGAWGYDRATDAEDLARRYEALLDAVRTSPILAGSCYTQLTDTYQEANGLLYADRTPKVPLERIRRATRGPRTLREEEIEREQREKWNELARPRTI